MPAPHWRRPPRIGPPPTRTTGTTSNNVAIAFPTPTAAWGTVTSYGIFDGPAGNLLFYGTLATAVAIGVGVTPVGFPAASLDILLN